MGPPAASEADSGRLGAFSGATSGAVVGGRPFLLSDHSLLYLAVVDVMVDGVRLEGVGVTPDLVVEQPLEYTQGDDAQLDAAVEHLANVITRGGED